MINNTAQCQFDNEAALYAIVTYLFSFHSDQHFGIISMVEWTVQIRIMLQRKLSEIYYLYKAWFLSHLSDIGIRKRALDLPQPPTRGSNRCFGFTFWKLPDMLAVFLYSLCVQLLFLDIYKTLFWYQNIAQGGTESFDEVGMNLHGSGFFFSSLGCPLLQILLVILIKESIL